MSKSKSRQRIRSIWRGQLTEYITSIAWSQDGEALVASSAEGEVVYWHGERLTPLVAATGATIDRLVFDASSRYLAAGGQTGEVRVWDCHEHQPKLLRSLAYKSIWIDSLVWHPTKPYLALAAGRFVQIWDIAIGELIVTLDFDLSTVFDLAWHPAGTHLAVAGNLGARIWQSDDWDAEPEYMPANNTIKHISWSPGGDFLAGATLDRCLLIGAVGSLQSTWAMSGFPVRIEQLAWIVGSQPTIAAISAEALVLWMFDDRTWQSTPLTFHQDFIAAMSVHPHRAWVATASVDGSIAIWDSASGIIGSIGSIDLDFTQILWHPHRQTLVTGSEQGEVTIWALESS
jgi:WD40 repeat protein